MTPVSSLFGSGLFLIKYVFFHSLAMSAVASVKESLLTISRSCFLLSQDETHNSFLAFLSFLPPLPA